MNTLDTYKIDLFDRNLVGKTYEFDSDDTFFAAIDGLVRRGNLHSTVQCLSAGTIMKFQIHSSGVVIVPCDRCLADLELRIETTDTLCVKLGDDYEDDGDCVTVPEAEGYINLAQYIYEFIALSMPITCQHEPGKCDDTMMQELSKHQTARSGYDDDDDGDSTTGADGEDGDNDAPIDSRWAALAKLKQ